MPVLPRALLPARSSPIIKSWKLVIPVSICGLLRLFPQCNDISKLYRYVRRSFRHVLGFSIALLKLAVSELWKYLCFRLLFILAALDIRKVVKGIS